MTRKYKFRIWSHHTNSMDQVDNEDMGYILDGADGLDPMQWIGRLDKNKREIYEEDIVVYTWFKGFSGVTSKRSGEVRFINGSYVIYFGEQDWMLISELEDDEMEVIGNTYAKT